MLKSVDQISDKVNQQMLITRSLADWRPILARECQVYQFENRSFLAKHFSQIHYTICDINTATDILIDNLYALLQNKYFDPLTDEALERINQIIKSFTTNLKTVLRTVSFYDKPKINDEFDNSEIVHIKNLPNGCVAFRNGVFDFRTNKFLFKYARTRMRNGTDIVEYPLEYVVRFYFNFNFEPFDFSIMDFTLSEFEQALKELDETQRNLCFELVHNMSFDEMHRFSLPRFEHLCQIMGYMCCSTIAEQFAIIFGVGQNGKDSLFRGCFTAHIIPTPSALSLDNILDTPFATGTLEGRCQNINLELAPKTYKDVAKLKALTGGEEVDIEKKGVQSHTGIINCKYLFAGNVQDDIKFNDTSNGFLRRVNVFNVHYVWDAQKNFMKRGDYFDTTFMLDDLKYDLSNAVLFVYLAMFGLKSATNNFTTDFKFTHNEWSNEYSSIDTEFVEKLNSIRIDDVLKAARFNKQSVLEFDQIIYSQQHHKFWRESFSPSCLYLPTQELYQNIVSADTDTIEFASVSSFLARTYSAPIYDNEGNYVDDIDIDVAKELIMSEDEIYLNAKWLQTLMKLDSITVRVFNKNIKLAFGQACEERIANNQPYIRCNFRSGRLQILR